MSRPGTWALNLSVHSETDANGVFTNMPAVEKFLFSGHQHVQLVDLAGMTQVCLKVNKQSTAGSSGTKLIVRAAHDFATTVGSFSTDIGASEVSVAINVQNSYLDSGWIDLADEWRMDDVFVAIVGSGGDGVLDHAFGAITLGFQ